MENDRKKDKLIWTIKILITYLITYLLCRRAFSKEWAWVLFLFGFAIILIASCFYLKKVMVFTVFGYIIGFLSGLIFNKDGRDIGGARTNNAWLIWTIVFLVIVTIGIIWEIINKRIKSNRDNRNTP